MSQTDTIILILAAHFVGDFLMQTNWMALGKSKKFAPLTVHVMVYSLPLMFFGIKFALVNAVVHWGVDYLSSRSGSWVWGSGNRKLFFIIIGLDQLIHTSILIYSANALGVLK